MADQVLYVTKYALTEGIQERILDREDEKYFFVKWPGACNNSMLLRKNEAFQTLAGANNRVVEMIDAKLKSLDKAKTKLQKLRALAVTGKLASKK